MRRIVMVGVLAAALMGCAPQQAPVSATPTPAVANSIAAVEIALTDAERLALIYKHSPAADPATVAKILDLDNKAYNAVVAARKNVTLIGTAIQLVSTFQAAIPK